MPIHPSLYAIWRWSFTYSNLAAAITSHLKICLFGVGFHDIMILYDFNIFPTFQTLKIFQQVSYVSETCPIATNQCTSRRKTGETLHRIKHIALELWHHSASSRIRSDVGLVPGCRSQRLFMSTEKSPKQPSTLSKSVETSPNPFKFDVKRLLKIQRVQKERKHMSNSDGQKKSPYEPWSILTIWLMVIPSIIRIPY
jgi:hypothetical protein